MYISAGTAVYQCRDNCISVQGQLYISAGTAVYQCRGSCISVQGQLYISAGTAVYQCRDSCISVQGQLYLCVKYVLFHTIFTTISAYVFTNITLDNAECQCRVRQIQLM